MGIWKRGLDGAWPSVIFWLYFNDTLQKKQQTMNMRLKQHVNQKKIIRTWTHTFLHIKRAKSSSQYRDNKDVDQNFSVFLSSQLEPWVSLKLLSGKLKETAYPLNNYFSILHLSFLNVWLCIIYMILATDPYWPVF